MTIKGLAPAKINLTLHVTGRRDDGYHLLDSLVAFADIGDHITATPGKDLSIDVTGPFAAGVPSDARNLLWRAAEVANWRGHITLDKRLPHAAGIGSGSSDAGTFLRLIDAQIAPTDVLSLGADVPVCLHGSGARMRGIGEIIDPAPLPELPALLVNPGVPVPTGAVFSDLVTAHNSPMQDQIPRFGDVHEVARWLKDQRNDLEVPAYRHARVLEDLLADLNCTGHVLLSRMSGSGATCFALYPTMKAAHFAAYEIGAAHPDWWCVACLLR